MKIDLHCHTKYSGKCSEWALKKLGMPESFTEPKQLYRALKKKGMTHVTVTDHNSIDGAIQIAHLDDVFVSEEVTTYFPEDRCALHTLVFDISESQHREIARLRDNVYDLVHYLNQEQIPYSLAHPLFSINDRLTLDHFERLLLLYPNFELNGSRNESLNDALRVINRLLSEDDVERLIDKHGIKPAFELGPRGLKKNFTGGSDDHSGLTLGCRFTEVKGAHSPEAFFEGLAHNQAQVIGVEATPETFVRNLYSIAYQFYKEKTLGKARGLASVLSSLDGYLLDKAGKTGYALIPALIKDKLAKGKKNSLANPAAATMMEIISEEMAGMRKSNSKSLARLKKKSRLDPNQVWFHLVNELSGRILSRFGKEHIKSLFQGNFLNLFQSLGSAGVVWMSLAPFCLGYSLFRKDVAFSGSVVNGFCKSDKELLPEIECSVGHFTDTLFEVNGVSRTLRKQVELSRILGKKYKVITCHHKKEQKEPGVKIFKALAKVRLDFYPDQRLFYPPVLEMMKYCYEKGFDRIHLATPGPVGLAGLFIARNLGLPVMATHHTDFARYMAQLTDDHRMEKAAWKYLGWFYKQMDVVFVPSKYSKQDLIQLGVDSKKLRVYPRGVDVNRFRPVCEKSGFEGLDPDAFKLLYVGRVSKEKNLEFLTKIFKALNRRHKNLQLVAVGEGPYLEEMKNSLKGLPCLFTGKLAGSALAEMYSCCDLFLFPSMTDTFGNVVLEAQACGLPVVVTNQGGPQENMINEKTGLIASGKSEASFLSAIETLMSDPRRLEKMKKICRLYAETRSIEPAFERAYEMWKMVGDSPETAIKFPGDSEFYLERLLEI
ncbi:MAG: glycosyltransferase [Candidatus Omnitrophica bacterium]|nr:glycosyltransferase [Candidatus Omnitrophota bacterium]